MNFLSSRLIIILLYLCGFASSAIANSYDSITYSLSLANIKDSVLKVEVTLNGKFKDKLILNLPFGWAGASYKDQIKNIKLQSNYNIKLTRGKENFRAIISIPNHSTDQIKISYDIHQKTGNPSEVHEAIIRETLVHSTGYGLLSLPSDLKDNDKIRVSINWKDIPEQWKTLSSYSPDNTMNLHIAPQELLHAFYIAGSDIRIHKIGDNKNPIFLSLYGKFDISDRKITSDISRIIRSQKDFFNDYDFPYAAISLIEGDDPRSMGGTRLINSFTAFIPKGLAKIHYYILFAHENLHNWIGGKISNNKDEELNYWFTEGFTDYYSRLIALRSKGIDKAEFVQEVNHILHDYYLSPVNQEPNSRIKKDYWNNYDIEKLPYYRGFVFAIYLNDMIQKENPGNSLDNIMYDLFAISKQQQFSSHLFKEIARRYLKENIDIVISNFIDKGNVISLENIDLPIEKVLKDKVDVYQIKSKMSFKEKKRFNKFLSCSK